MEELVYVADANERIGVQVREDLQQDLRRESAEREKKERKPYFHYCQLLKS